MGAGFQKFAASGRRRCYELLDQGPVGDLGSGIVGRFIALLVVSSLVAVALESVPEYAARYHQWFDLIEITALAVFTVEYVLRIWVAVEHPLYRHMPPRRARLRYIASAPGIVDLIAVAPFWLAFYMPGELRVLTALRVLRFLKLSRYSPAIRSLLDSIYAERRALIGCFVILLGSSLIVGTLMHLIEGNLQPAKFGTIPDAMWWAIVTLGTIGYGDAVPITVAGRVLATCTIFLGLIMVALPVGIVATAFANDIHRREFVVTWAMIARVPLFSGLNADQIAAIMRLLQSQYVESGTIIARRGEEAHSMYFIAAGEVEIELQDRCIRLGAGHFFGEIAVLRKARRSATITAMSRASLLVLAARDVHVLMDHEPQIAARIREIFRNRIGSIEEKGDLTVEEISEAGSLKQSE
jgi:voltage-gated potassium channel